LEQIFAVEVIENDEGARSRRLEHAEIGGHLNSSNVHDVKGFPRQPARQPLRVRLRCQPQRHVGLARREHAAQPVAEGTHRQRHSFDATDRPQRIGLLQGLPRGEERKYLYLVPRRQAGDEPPVAQRRPLLRRIWHLRRQKQNPHTPFLIYPSLPDTPPMSPGQHAPR